MTISQTSERADRRLILNLPSAPFLSPSSLSTSTVSQQSVLTTIKYYTSKYVLFENVSNRCKREKHCGCGCWDEQRDPSCLTMKK